MAGPPGEVSYRANEFRLGSIQLGPVTEQLGIRPHSQSEGKDSYRPGLPKHPELHPQLGSPFRPTLSLGSRRGGTI